MNAGAAPPQARLTTPEQVLDRASELEAKLASEQGDFAEQARQALANRKRMLRQHVGLQPAAGVPGGPCGWTHGDFQFRNQLCAQGCVVAVLDWDRIGVRPYVEEVARTEQVQFSTDGCLALAHVGAFTTGYRKWVSLDADSLADGARRLWWKRLTDFWQLEFYLDRLKAEFADMFLADEALLCWWTQRLDQVEAASLRPLAAGQETGSNELPAGTCA
ncbi:phosphotransferase [Streptomyces fractus]|uniref:phosphotransferase n=1 Tax=Streptomyces fractus TaxID=641806 RepID=UPI003CF7F8E2